MNNRILTNIDSTNLEEIILEEILPLDEQQLTEYVENMVAELFHSFCWFCGKSCGKRNTLKNIG